MTPTELWLRLTYPFRRARIERELREEIALHLERRAEQLVRDGATARDALLAARQRFGNAPRIVDASRAAWGWHWLDGAAQDLRYIGRQLRRSPLFAAVTMLTIALGVAVNAAAFTFYDAIVLKPLPVRAPATVVRIAQDLRIPDPTVLPFDAYTTVRDAARTLDSVVATSEPQPLAASLPGHSRDDRRLVAARFVSTNYFAALGVQPLAGRAFNSDDTFAAVVSHEFWTRELNADRGVLGRTVMAGTTPVTIVGIAPPGFAGTGEPAVSPDLWIPLAAEPALAGGDWRYDGLPHWQILARLAPHAAMADVANELTILARAVPDSLGKPRPLVAKHAVFFQPDSGEFAAFLQVATLFMAALVLVLGIGAVNLVNLFAARNAARESEIAVRLALGASRSRIARQLAAESVLLALAGGALGLALSWRFAHALRDWLLVTLPAVSGGVAGIFLDLSLDWRIVVYTVALSGAIGLGIGLWPALRASRSEVIVLLKSAAASTPSPRQWSARNALLVVQVAGCIVLLAAAGVLLSGARRAGAIEPGFDADHVIAMLVDVPGGSVADRSAAMRDVMRTLGQLPEVRAVAWSHRIPFAGTHLRTGDAPGGGRRTISVNGGSAAYFEATGTPIVSGRGFTEAEVADNLPVVVVSQSLARIEWPNQNPIGKVITPPSLLLVDTLRAYTVIGVARDVRTNFLSRVDAPSVYFPEPIDHTYGVLLIRTRADAAVSARAIAIALDTKLPTLSRAVHFTTLRQGPMAVQRLMAQLPATIALGLALAGLVLASIGVYGLISQIVTRRTREIGVHVALGARAEQVVAMVMRRTLRPVVWGAVLGLIGASAVSTVLRAVIAQPDFPDLTYGTGAFNPAVFGVVLGALAVVVLAACYIPARRAARVDAIVALRSE